MHIAFAAILVIMSVSTFTTGVILHSSEKKTNIYCIKGRRNIIFKRPNVLCKTLRCRMQQVPIFTERQNAKCIFNQMKAGRVYVHKTRFTPPFFLFWRWIGMNLCTRASFYDFSVGLCNSSGSLVIFFHFISTFHLY